MIICETPLRVSFFGGGSDFPEHFRRHSGAVLGTAIDKHIYHTVSRFPSELFDYSIRLAYRRVECVQRREQIEHLPFRRILEHFGIDKDIEVSLAADLPSFAGLGSSSSFTVGLINALSAYQGRFLSKDELARKAIYVERELLQEAVGWQDQILAAYGSLNLIEFSGNDRFTVHRVCLSESRLQELQQSLLLFYTGIQRRAADVERKKLRNMPQLQDALCRIHRHVEQAHRLLTGSGPLEKLGQLLHESWQEKRGLDSAVSTPRIDHLYELALASGAWGGKLLGAGGGGFMLLLAPPERQSGLRQALAEFPEVRFRINAPGSHIIHS